MKLSIKHFISSFVAILIFCNIAVASPNFYFYPEGQRPDSIPVDSESSTGIALSAWADVQIDGNESLFAFGNDEMAHSELGFDTRAPAHILFKFNEAYSYILDPIQSADLFLYVNGASTPNPALTMSVARVTTTWDENTVTYNSAPSYGATQPGYESTLSLNSRIAIDVRDSMELERLSIETDRHGLILLDASKASPLLFTKESTIAEYRPYIHVFVPEPFGFLIYNLGFLICFILRNKI